jgi:hypothetical protein
MLVIGRRSTAPGKKGPGGLQCPVAVIAVLWVQFLVLCEHVNELPNARCTRLGLFRRVNSPQDRIAIGTVQGAEKRSRFSIVIQFGLQIIGYADCAL